MILLSDGTNHASQKDLSAARMCRSRAAGFLGLAHLGGIVVAREADLLGGEATVTAGGQRCEDEAQQAQSKTAGRKPDSFSDPRRVARDD